MKCDLVLAGVGGQGVLSLSVIIASAAMRQGLHVKQSEVHGMAQRGGAVVANLRLSDQVIHADLIGKGTADLILALEAVESLRYLEFLNESGQLITSSERVLNIPNYPAEDELLTQIRALPNGHVVDALTLARQAGSPRATNMVMIGAASHHLPLEAEWLESEIRTQFQRKGSRVVEINIEAFRLGRGAYV